MKSATEKKIDALIDALGFDVKIDFDFDEKKESKSNASLFASSYDYPHTRGRKLKTGIKSDPSNPPASPYIQDALLADEDGNYTSMLIELITNYTLTKRAVK